LPAREHGLFHVDAETLKEEVVESILAIESM
jgi:hypothetical protein